MITTHEELLKLLSHLKWKREVDRRRREEAIAQFMKRVSENYDRQQNHIQRNA